MTLNKRVVPVSLGLGLDTKTDSKQVEGALLSVENAFVRKTGELQKRNGYLQLSQNVLDAYYADGYADPITDAINIATFQDELILSSSTNIYSWAPELEVWVDRGTDIFVETSTSQVQSNSYQQTSPDVAIANGIAAYVWEDSRGGVYSLIVDVASGVQLLADTLLNANGEKPKIIAIGNYFFSFYFDSTTQELLMRRILVLSPTSWETEILIASDIEPSYPNFDVIVYGSRMIATYSTTSADTKLFWILQNGDIGAPINGVPAPINVPIIADWALSLVANNTGISLVYAESTTGLNHTAYTLGFIIDQAVSNIDSTISTTIRNIGVLYNSDTLEIFYEYEAPIAMNNYVKYAVYDLSTETSTTEIFQLAAGLASKPFSNDRATSICLSFESESGFQNTYFVVNTLGEIEAKMLYSLAGGHTTNTSLLPSVITYNDIYYIPALQFNRQIVGANSTLTLSGLSQLTLNYNSTAQGNPAELGENLHYPGGFVKAFDGQSVVEHNFHMYPEQPTITTDGGGGNIGTGTYLYKIVYEWIDAKGQLVQSATSTPTSHSVSGNHSVDLDIPSLRYTAKKAPLRSPVIVSIYRTEDGGTIYYKVSDDTSPLYNDTTTNYVSFNDNISDANLILRPLLYTTGGILDNAAAPPCNLVISAKNRLFAGGLQDRNALAYSKEFSPEVSVNFSDFLTLQVPSKGGRITALAELDDKLIIFKQNAIYSLTGAGPTSTGQNDDFVINAVVSDVGCTTPKSVVLTPQGLMFKSGKGIWLLDRGLATSYVGDRVEDFNDLTITSAIVVPDYNEARFTTSIGTSLVYNYYFNQWTTFTNQAATGAVNWNNYYLYSTASGSVLQETIGTFSDNGSPVISSIGTQWFTFSGIQGFQRVYKLMILGEYVGNHNLKVLVYYNYNDYASEQFTYNMESNGFSEVYGESSPYGSGLFGGDTSIYQFEIKPAKQKCQSMRIVIEDYYPSGDPTGGFKISQVALQVGSKAGLNKLPSNQVMRST